MHCPFKPHVLLTSFYDRSIIGQTVDRLHSLADVLEVNRGRNLNEQELFESLPGMHASIAADDLDADEQAEMDRIDGMDASKDGGKAKRTAMLSFTRNFVFKQAKKKGRTRGTK